MFNTYVLRPGDAHHTHTYHEHRAPTDQSVALLREMEKAALDKVIQAVRLENCGVDAVLHHMRDSLNDQRRFKIIYKINGERRVVDYDHTETGAFDDREKMLMGLRDAFAKDIANVLTAAVLKAAGKFSGF